MRRTEIKRLLRNHVHGVRDELELLVRDVERSLAAHLKRIETAIADACEAGRRRKR